MSNPPRIVLKPRKAPTITLPRRRTLPAEEAPAASDVDDTGDGDAAMDVDVTVNDDAAEGANTPGRTPDVADGDADDGAGSLRDASEPGDDAPHPASLEAQSEVGPSRGRGRGRPRGRPRGSRGRGRGRGRGATTIRLPREDGEEGELEEGAEADDGRPQFKKVGTRMYVLEGDELATDDDPKGDTKIDKDGSLIGDRVFKANTFNLTTRHPTRLYMLAIDAARSSGFRDSLYYFRRNPLAHKLNATQAEKDDLIARGKLAGHLRTRAVTLITARSAYKLHGAKTIQDGRWVIDDYYEDRALEEIEAKGLKPGDPVGELVDPRAPKEIAELAGASDAMGGRGADRGERGAGLGMYRAGGPTTLFGSAGIGPFSEGPLSAPKKAFFVREGVTEQNFMLEAARRTRAADADWARGRKEALRACGGVFDANAERLEGVAEEERQRELMLEYPVGVYEPHSGVVLYRTDTQPTRARWESLPYEPDDGTGADAIEAKRPILGGSKVGRNAWALAWIDTQMELPTDEERAASIQPTLAKI